MNTIKNIKGCIVRPLGDFSEDFKIRGLLLPKDEVSRNGVLYDWDSIKAKAKAFEGVPLNYNHIIDDDKPPIGKITKTSIKEKEDEDGPAGMYYEAEVDEDSEYANSIKKGMLNKVSIQVTADAQEEEYKEDGSRYTRAMIGDPLEVSVVKVPGFNQTTMEVALAEAFGRKSEAIRIGDKVHSPSGYGKVIKIFGKKVIVRSNDPAGDFEYDMKDVQKEQISTNNIPSQTKLAKKEEAYEVTCGKCPAKFSDEVKKKYGKVVCPKCGNTTGFKYRPYSEFTVVDMLTIISEQEAAELLESFEEVLNINSLAKEIAFKVDKWMSGEPDDYFNSDKRTQLNMIDSDIDNYFNKYLNLKKDGEWVSKNRSKIIQMVQKLL